MIVSRILHQLLTAQASSESLCRGFDLLAQRCDFLGTRDRTIALAGAGELPLFVFEGPQGGGEPLRIGLFAGIHGDETAGPSATLKVAQILARDPRLAEGYHIYFYPVCNPYGFERGVRHGKSGKDLNREFWRNSPEPEVQFLEREIREHAFHGLISLHSDDTSDGLYGFVRGAVLSKSLLAPALAAAEQFLPRNMNDRIDGFRAEQGIISECYDGILTSAPGLANTPWEIIFETPQHAELEKQVDASVAATLSILSEYRKFIAFAADL